MQQNQGLKEKQPSSKYEGCVEEVEGGGRSGKVALLKNCCFPSQILISHPNTSPRSSYGRTYSLNKFLLVLVNLNTGDEVWTLYQKVKINSFSENINVEIKNKMLFCTIFG
jgi:hypothetical protein